MNPEEEFGFEDAAGMHDEIRRLRGQVKELGGWLTAIWMAFLADEETHELAEVLRRLSAWMVEQEESAP